MSKIYDTSRMVFTGESWLMNMFNGYKEQNNLISIVFDADNKPIIGKGIAHDPAYNLNILITNPNTNETKPLIEWLEEIPYCYLEDS